VCGSSLVGRVGVAYNPVPQYRFASGRVGSMGYSPMGHFFAYEFLTASRKTHFTTKEGFRGSDPACVFFLFFFMVIISIILRVHIVTIAAVIWRSGQSR
jgi:hypothetical protein